MIVRSVLCRLELRVSSRWQLSSLFAVTAPCAVVVKIPETNTKTLALHVRSARDRQFALIVNGRELMRTMVGRGGVFYRGKPIMDRGELFVLETMALTYSDKQ